MSIDNSEGSAYPITGLNEGETIQWNRGARLSYVICVVRGILPMIALIFLIGIIGTLGGTMGAGALAFSIIFPWVGLTGLLIMFFYALYIVLQPRRTWYYLTNQRLLEVRDRSIVKEIPRMNFKDLDPKQFI